MKRSWKKMLSTALFAVMIAALAWYLYDNRADLAQLLTLSPGVVTAMFVFGLGACVMNCLYHKLILDTYRIPLGVVDWMGVVFAANALAFVLPMRGDLLFTAAYYRRTKGLAYVKSASIAAGNIVFSVLFALLQMAAALICTGIAQGQWPALLWLVLACMTAAVAAFLVLALWFGDRMPAFLNRIKVVRDVVQGFNDLLRNRALLLRLLGCLIVNNVLHLFLYIACFRGIGMEVTLYQALFYNSISRLCTLVAIVPGNLGIKQGVMGVAGALMGDVFHNSVMVSLLQSVTLMVIYMVMGGVFAYPVWRNWNRAEGLK